jgi:peptide/nickel transport system ATP-binding protein
MCWWSTVVRQLASSGPGTALDVRNLRVCFRTPAGDLEAVSDVSFMVGQHEMVGMVGESGSGKSATALALLGLLPPHSARVTGQVTVRGHDVIGLDEKALRHVRGRDIGMIFQEPMTALDPVFRVGRQIAQAVRAHEAVSRQAAKSRAIELLVDLGIPDPARVAEAYPHQLSGGMAQRVTIAIALASAPAVLVADEPTTALDVTIEAQILDLLRTLSREHGTGILLITHDLGIVAESCTRMVTLYAGQVVEEATVEQALERPLHPYTSGLIRSLPQSAAAKAPLYSIPGRVPTLAAMPAGCRFGPRCEYAEPTCHTCAQELAVSGGRTVRCQRYRELTLVGARDLGSPSPHDEARA